MLAAGFVVTAVATMAASPAAGAASTQSTSSDTALAAARALVGWIPAEQRYQCHIDDITSEEELGANIYAERAHLRTSLTCGADGDWTTLDGYATFTSAAAAERVFDAYTGTNGAYCEQPTAWSSGGQEVGRVACYQTSTGGTSDGRFPYSVIVWTYEPLHLLAWAYDDQNDAARLQEWWNNRAGPLPAKEPVPELPASPSTRVAASSLAARLPRSTRATCSRTSLDEQPFDAQVYRWRLWVVSALACRPRSEADTLFFVSVAPDALAAFFDNRYANVPDTRANGESCPARYVYEMDDRKVSDPYGLGTLACSFRDGNAVVGWSVLSEHVVSEATGPNADSLLHFAAAAGPQRNGRFQPANVVKPG